MSNLSVNSNLNSVNITLDNPHPQLARFAPVTFHDPVDAVFDGLQEYYGSDPATYARGCARFEAALATCCDEMARYDLAAIWLTSMINDAQLGGAR